MLERIPESVKRFSAHETGKGRPLLPGWLWLVISALSLAIAAAIVVTGLVMLADPSRPLLYLIDIFTVPVLCGVGGVICVLALIRQTGAAIVAGLGALCMALSLAPDPVDTPFGPTTGPVRLVFANLLIRNPTPEALLPWIEAQSPDIVALVEANRRAHSALIPALERDYPHIVRRYDMYILSRYPLSDIVAGPPGTALLTARVHHPEKTFTLAVAHLTRPWPFTTPDDQPRQIRRLTRRLSGGDEPLVLCGDFNSAGHTAPMRGLRRSLGLAEPGNITGTWPSPLPGPLRIGIDHIMAGRGIVASGRKVGPFYGSDHRPVRVDLTLFLPDA